MNLVKKCGYFQVTIDTYKPWQLQEYSYNELDNKLKLNIGSFCGDLTQSYTIPPARMIFPIVVQGYIKLYQ